MTFFFCDTCRTLQLGQAAQAMTEQGKSAQAKAILLTHMAKSSAGWMVGRCKHKQCQQKEAPQAVSAALSEASAPNPSQAPSLQPELQPLAEAGEAALATPRARARAQAYEIEQVEREEREANRSRIERHQQIQLWREDQAQKTWHYRDKMTSQGLVEVALDPGEPTDGRAYEHIAMRYQIEFEQEDVAHLGAEAVLYALEQWADDRSAGEMKPYVLNEAMRVQRGLYRLFMPLDDVADPDFIVHSPDEEEDAFVVFDEGPKSRLPMKWCPPPSLFHRESVAWANKVHQTQMERERGKVVRLSDWRRKA